MRATRPTVSALLRRIRAGRLPIASDPLPKIASTHRWTSIAQSQALPRLVYVYVASALVAVAAITFGLSRVKQAAPKVDRGYSGSPT